MQNVDSTIYRAQFKEVDGLDILWITFWFDWQTFEQEYWNLNATKCTEMWHVWIKLYHANILKLDGASVKASKIAHEIVYEMHRDIISFEYFNVKLIWSMWD